MKKPEQMIVAAVRAITSELKTSELVGVNLCMQLGSDPRYLAYYDKVAVLFDSKDSDGIPVAHDLTRRAVFMAVKQRIEGGDQ